MSMDYEMESVLLNELVSLRSIYILENNRLRFVNVELNNNISKNKVNNNPHTHVHDIEYFLSSVGNIIVL